MSSSSPLRSVARQCAKDDQGVRCGSWRIPHFNDLFGSFVVFLSTAQIQCEQNKSPADTDHLTVRPTPQPVAQSGLRSHMQDLPLYSFTKLCFPRLTRDNRPLLGGDQWQLHLQVQRQVLFRGRSQEGLKSWSDQVSGILTLRWWVFLGENYWPLRWKVDFVWRLWVGWIVDIFDQWYGLFRGRLAFGLWMWWKAADDALEQCCQD